MTATDQPAHIPALLRHFADLRDRTHGDVTSRTDKERLFAEAVTLLDPHARHALAEIDTHLLLGTGDVSGTGPHRTDAGVSAQWTLSWPEQRNVGVAPITIDAFFAADFHHPHLRGATTGVWPLNVFTAEQAADELPVLRAIAAADLHNLVFQADYRIVPATTRRGG